jgi:hypothetical protein
VNTARLSEIAKFKNRGESRESKFGGNPTDVSPTSGRSRTSPFLHKLGSTSPAAADAADTADASEAGGAGNGKRRKMSKD